MKTKLFLVKAGRAWPAAKIADTEPGVGTRPPAMTAPP